MKNTKGLYRLAFDWMGALFLCCLMVLALTGEWTGVAAKDAAPIFMHTGDTAPLIVVDAGHGGADGGAQSADNVKEAGINLAVSKLVENGLKEAGFEVVMTRRDDKALAGDKKQDMKARRELMRTDGVSAVVSVHMNKWRDSAVNGPMVFYMKGSEAGERLASAIITSICDSTGRARRPANPGDYYVLRESIAPAVIVECGFLSNPEDLSLLQSPDYHQKLAIGISAGIAEFFAATDTAPTPTPQSTAD